MIQTFVFYFVPLYFSLTRLSSTSVSELVSWSLYSVTSPSRFNASDSSSAGFLVPNSSKIAEYCSVGIISSRFVIVRLGYGELRSARQLSVETIGASRRNVTTSHYTTCIPVFRTIWLLSGLDGWR
ncbi:hypothetical protein AVEN_60639-1 [Araneus ventricosus]|uniref:Uncharacterized protein n=1 Tax=Araneus ventricosus TaxID=182803 RepID=A0A4Y2KWH8_ARAVE|nr:hypothetical protein AVEN_60639-1 [Araneus ventricosus]